MEIMSSPAVGQARSRISVAHRPSPAIDAGQTIVCLPTYNEAPNIEGLIAAIRRSLPHATVLVVDDGVNCGQIPQRITCSRVAPTLVVASTGPGSIVSRVS